MSTSSSTPRVLTPAQVQAVIKRNNAKWAKASPAERRVLIAKDIIARLNSNQYRAEHYIYSRIGSSGAADFQEGDQVQQCLVDGSAQCACCARGALFFSHILFKNKVSIRDIKLSNYDASNDSDRAGLDRVFSRAQQFLIEAAFEGWDKGDAEGDNNPYGSDRTVAFHHRYGSAERRLHAIATNIIDNKGTFILPKDPTS